MLHPRVRTFLLSLTVVIVLVAIVILLLKGRAVPFALVPQPVPELDLAVSTPDGYHNVSPGSQKIVSFTVRNNTDAIETYSLRVLSSPGIDWVNPQDIPDTIVVQSGQEARIPVMVTIPPDAIGYTEVNLRATPLSNPTLALQQEIMVLVAPEGQFGQ